MMVLPVPGRPSTIIDVVAGAVIRSYWSGWSVARTGARLFPRGAASSSFSNTSRTGVFPSCVAGGSRSGTEEAGRFLRTRKVKFRGGGGTTKPGGWDHEAGRGEVRLRRVILERLVREVNDLAVAATEGPDRDDLVIPLVAVPPAPEERAGDRCRPAEDAHSIDGGEGLPDVEVGPAVQLGVTAGEHDPAEQVSILRAFLPTAVPLPDLLRVALLRPLLVRDFQFLAWPAHRGSPSASATTSITQAASAPSRISGCTSSASPDMRRSNRSCDRRR